MRADRGRADALVIMAGHRLGHAFPQRSIVLRLILAEPRRRDCNDWRCYRKPIVILRQPIAEEPRSMARPVFCGAVANSAHDRDKDRQPASYRESVPG